jgi:polyisoprenoid-binding protein YceI
VLAAAAVLAVLVVGGAYLVFVLVSGGSKPPLAIDLEPQPGTTIDGTWRATRGHGSVVGYRVREKLVYLPAPHDAVGRTAEVNGELDVTTGQIRRLVVRANLSTLVSDRAQRDEVLRNEGPMFERFPAARFVLVKPISLEGVSGRAIRREAEGDFTLHGTTRRVAVPFEAVLHGRVLETVGRFTIRFAEYGFEPPKRPVVRIASSGAVEFRLRFRKVTT